MNARHCGHMRRLSTAPSYAVAVSLPCDGRQALPLTIIHHIRFGRTLLGDSPKRSPNLNELTAVFWVNRPNPASATVFSRASATICLPAMVKTERELREDICQVGRLV